MKLFIIKLTLYLLPVIGIFGFPLVVMQMAGELTHVDRVIAAQISDQQDILYGQAYSEVRGYYKLNTILASQPTIIVQGTSRTQQFREEFFAEDVQFYNAGGGVLKAEHLPSFLATVTQTYQPEVIIVGLDHSFFNPNWNDGFIRVPYHQFVINEANATSIIIHNWRQVYRDYGQAKFSLLKVLNDQADVRNLGLNAITNSHGFRNDGSRDYGITLQKRDLEFQETMSRIEKGTVRFQHGDTLSPERLAAVETFLQQAQSHDIHIIGYLPPFAPKVNQKLQVMGEKYGYMNQINDALIPMFEQYQARYYDFTDVTWLGADDAEFIDGFHGSEKIDLRILIHMAKTDEVLRPYVADLSFLEAQLEQVDSDTTLFGYGD